MGAYAHATGLADAGACRVLPRNQFMTGREPVATPASCQGSTMRWAGRTEATSRRTDGTRRCLCNSGFTAGQSRMPHRRLRRSEASTPPVSALTRSFAAELLAGGAARARFPRNSGALPAWQRDAPRRESRVCAPCSGSATRWRRLFCIHMATEASCADEGTLLLVVILDTGLELVAGFRKPVGEYRSCWRGRDGRRLSHRDDTQLGACCRRSRPRHREGGAARSFARRWWR
jgi:hypothetical protein